MQTTDKIADLLTRIRNAQSAKHDYVNIPMSKMKKSILEMLVREGYVRRFSVVKDGGQLFLRVYLKYKEGKKPVIMGLKKVSKPGLRVYSNVREMPRVIRGLGIAIISTSKGILTDRQARRMNVGGEVLAYVW